MRFEIREFFLEIGLRPKSLKPNVKKKVSNFKPHYILSLSMACVRNYTVRVLWEALRGDVSVNKELLTGIVSVNKELLTGTVPVNNSIQKEIPFFFPLYLIIAPQIKLLIFPKSKTAVDMGEEVEHLMENLFKTIITMEKMPEKKAHIPAWKMKERKQKWKSLQDWILCRKFAFCSRNN